MSAEIQMICAGVESIDSLQWGRAQMSAEMPRTRWVPRTRLYRFNGAALR